MNHLASPSIGLHGAFAAPGENGAFAVTGASHVSLKYAKYVSAHKKKKKKKKYLLHHSSHIRLI
jgi:hypothetical protein